jgi:hypothetical protein
LVDFSDYHTSSGFFKVFGEIRTWLLAAFMSGPSVIHFSTGTVITCHWAVAYKTKAFDSVEALMADLDSKG